MVLFNHPKDVHVFRGVARIFQRGGGGHTVSNIILMAFSPRNIVGCLLKKRPTKGGGVTGTPGPPPRYALGVVGKGDVALSPKIFGVLFLNFLDPPVNTKEAHRFLFPVGRRQYDFPQA